MERMLLRCWVEARYSRVATRWRTETGEGVISTAIAVLIMALIGLAMWQLFDTVFSDAGERVSFPETGAPYESARLRLGRAIAAAARNSR